MAPNPPITIQRPPDLSSSGVRPQTKAASVRPSPFLLPLDRAFYLCFISHIISAVNAPIQDCDETFNYWEPLHYMNHGYGLQTWEYSPEFGIRSWLYIAIHSLPVKLASLFGGSKIFQFYFLRILLAFVCAGTEIRLYSAIARTLNPRIAVFYLGIVAFTPGFFYASTAFLPSSFAMYTSTLGLTAFMDWRGGSKTATGIAWFGMGATIGWPFAGALILPFVLEDWFVASVVGGNAVRETLTKYIDGAVRCLLILAWQVGIDSSVFYRKLVVVPWRLVAYNVFSGKGEGRGPNIFGTEPWDYYVRNLLLNFNVWFVLAVLAGPLLAVQALVFKQKATNQTLLRTVVFMSPFYLWLGVFTLQPHKEERFMFPAYPFLALNASVSFHMLLTWIGTSDPKTLTGKVPVQVKLALVIPVVILSFAISLLRILGTVTAYSAPMHVYDSLQVDGAVRPSSTVCFGKDWYRFPSSHFLPNGTHAKFVRSAFDGLLPGEFDETRAGPGKYPGAWTMPSGMNDQNEEDPAKYININHCSYLVDSYTSDYKPTLLEPLYARDKEWEKVSCLPFLDSSATGTLARIIWTPSLDFMPKVLKRVWGEHCLLRRRPVDALPDPASTPDLQL